MRRLPNGLQMLDLFDDANIYQTWAYGAVRWGRKNLSHLVLKRNGEVVGDRASQNRSSDKVKFGMAYLRWGPLCHRRGSTARCRNHVRMTRRPAKGICLQTTDFYCRSCRTRLPDRRAELFQSAFSAFTQEPRTSANTYRTFVLDLAPPLEELRRNLDKKWRNQLTRVGKERIEGYRRKWD